MRECRPTPSTIERSDLAKRLPDLVEAVARGEARILIEERGAPVAALVSAADLDRLIRMDEQDREAWTVLEAMRAPFRDIPPEEIEREAAKSVAEARAEMRAEREAATTPR